MKEQSTTTEDQKTQDKKSDLKKARPQDHETSTLPKDGETLTRSYDTSDADLRKTY